MFGKPTGDLYFTSYQKDAQDDASGYNKINYYDKSSDSCTTLMNSDTSYYNWGSGYSNRYLLLRNNSSNPC